MRDFYKNYKPKGVLSRMRVMMLMLVASFLFAINGNTQDVIIGEGGTATSSWIPIYYLYDYSISQTIYTAAELQAEGAQAGDISQIAYLPGSSVSTIDWRNWSIWIGHTTKTSFTGTTDWIAVSGMQQVFVGDVPANVVSGQWMEIDLDSDFAWNGTDNIVIAVRDNTNGWGGSPSWRGYAAGGNRGIYAYRDGTPYDFSAPPTASGTTATLPQIKFGGTLLPACATADAGVVEGGSLECANAPFTLVAVGASTGESGLIGQWQSSANGTTWNDIAGETSPTLIATITADTYFRYTMECTYSGDSEESNALYVELNTNISECYCIPVGTNSSYYIDNFSTTGGTTSDISNLGSGFSPGGYGNFFNDHSVAQEIGSSVNFSTSIQGGTAGFRIWVDWNQDGFFDPVTEVAYQSSAYSATHSGTFNVPATALNGATRMRIVSHWLSNSGDIDPCATAHTYGEFEDYKFVVGQESTGGGTWVDCEQDYYVKGMNPGAYDNGYNINNQVANAFRGANDVKVPAWTTFKPEYLTFDVISLGGAPTSFRLQMAEDNGGMPGTMVPPVYILNPGDYVSYVSGSLLGFDVYRIEIDISIAGIELENNTANDAYWWLVIDSDYTTTASSLFWMVAEGVAVDNPAYVYNSGVWEANPGSEYAMKIEGQCLAEEPECDIICPEDITVETNPGECDAYVSLIAGINSECESLMFVSNDYNGGGYNASDRFPVGTTEVTFTYENGKSCTVTVTVENNNGPVFENCPADQTIVLQPGECYFLNFQDTLIAYNPCSTGGGPGGPIEAIFTESAGAPGNFFNSFAGVTFDIRNDGTSPLTVTGFRVPVDAGLADFDIYYTTTASTNVGNQTNPGAWTLLDSQNGITAPQSVAWDVNTFTQITLGNTLTLAAGESKGFYIFLTNYNTGPSYHYTNGNFTATNGTISVLSNGYGSNGTVFGNTFADRAFVGEVQYAAGSGGGGGAPATVTQISGEYQLGDYLPAGVHCFEFEAEDEEGRTATCEFCITVEEYPYVNGNLSCNDLIHVDLGKECHACINAAHLLEGGPYGCYETRYTVIVATDAGFTNIIGEGNEVCFDGSHAGGTFYGKVIDNVTGNSCTGQIKVFDTHIPDLECGSYTVDCGDDIYPDADVEVVEGLVLNYSHDTVSINDALACAGTGTAVNNYYRVFDMDLLDIPGDFNVEKFNLGIYQSLSNINCVVRFYTFNNPSDYDVNAQSFSLGLTSQIGDDIDVVIPNGLNVSVHSWDISDAEIEIPLSARYVVAHIEIEGNPADWVAGVNSAGEDGPSYLSSDDCGISDPSTYASIGFGDLHLVMMVYGSSGSGVGFPLPEGVTVTPTTGEGPFIVSGFDACGDVTMTYEDTVIDGDCSTEFASVIYRDWTVVDESGNTTSCQDTINIRHPDINNFVFPGDVEYLLSDYGCGYDFSGEDFGLEQGVCGMFYGWEDRVLELCGEGQKIIRDYYAMYCCSGEVAEGRQIIKIIDDLAPTIEACNPDITLSTDFYDCDADYNVPPIIATKCETELNWPGAWDIASSAGTVVISGNNVVIRGLPLGTHTVTYTVTDDCGNEASCVQTVTVRDDVPPVAVCDHNTRVSIGADGEGRVHWTTIEDGSYDNCEIVKHEVRRKNVSRYCGRNNVWGEYVYFCCADIDQLVEVEYRVTDASGNTNICTVNVTVENGIPPQMTAPGPITVSCEFGDLPSKSDLKDLFDSNQSAALDLLRDIFGKVADLDAGESRDDIIITDSGILGCGYGNTTNNWGIDGFAIHNCGLNIKESYVDNRNECGVGRIFRSWQLLNDLDQPIGQPVNQVVTVENCNPFGIADITWPRDLTISGTCGEYEEDNWGEPSYRFNNDCHMVAATYTDEVYELVANDCEYKVLRHWTVINCCVDNKVLGNGIWTYTQEIRVKSIEDAPVIDVADVTTCANELDCGDTHVDLVASATSCVPGEMLKWSYRVDMNSNGDWDRVGVGADASGFFGMGTHTVEFTVEDGCGNSSVATVTVTVNDCTKPTPVCYTLATEVMDPVGYVDLPAKLFDAGSWDNCTSSENLIISYSSDVTDLVRRFTCDDLGLIEVEIWVTDEAGNQAFCRQILDLQDNENVCPDDGSLVSGRVGVESTDAPAVGFEVEVERSNVPAPLLLETNDEGGYSFVAGADYSYDISSSNNENPLNGVSTWDLTLIQQHILGMNVIVSPYKLIAADINRDGRITPVDLVELRRVILQLDKEFANNSSWQMVVASENLPGGVVPVDYEQVISLSNVSSAISGQDFVAVKIGDLNNSANASEGRSGNEFVMNVADMNYVRGEEVRVPVMAGSDASIFGYQMTLEVASNLRYTGIEAGAFDISGEHVGAHRVSEGLLSMSWNDVNALSVSEGEVLFTLVFEAVEGGSLNHALVASDVITRNEAYVNGEIDRVVMRVGSDASGLFALYQNEPNPFGDITSISFDLPESGAATLTVYNAQGQVEHVIEGNYESGRTTISIERSELGAAGIKYYSLKSGDYTATKKMIVIK